MLASVAAHRRRHSRRGEDAVAALNGGYHVAFLVGAFFAASAGTLALVRLRAPAVAPMPHGEPAPAAAIDD